MIERDITQAIAPVQCMRLHDWQMRYAALVQERLAAPMVWGQHDCCLWASDVVLALTGVDPAASLRGQYVSEKQALRLVRSLGGLEAIASAALGVSKSAALAQIGDVLLLTQSGRSLLAVCNGGHALAVGEQGLQIAPLPLRGKAWSV